MPQGSVLGQVLCVLYTCDIPAAENIKLATIADNDAVLALVNTIKKTTADLQGTTSV